MSQFIYVNVIGFPDGNIEPAKASLVHGNCFKIIGEDDDDEHCPWAFETG